MILYRTWNALAVSEYFGGITGISENVGTAQFRHLCSAVEKVIMQEISEEHKNSDYGAEEQHGALLGKPDSVRYFCSKIAKYLKYKNYGNVEYPACYESLVEAIFHETWGYSCLAEWFKMDESQSAKIIGDKIYYMVRGRAVLQPYTMPLERRLMLKNSLLLNTPDSNRSSSYVQMTLLTGERVIIFDNELTKANQDVIVFRKYTVKDYSWEEQARRGTIHRESINLMKHLSRAGFNELIVGQVRSGKTTILQTIQSYEAPHLEGVAIESIDEIKFHKVNPGSPVMQLLKTKKTAEEAATAVLHSDADYIILAEAMDGEEFALAVDLANKGTHHCKTTIHTTDVSELLYFITNKILECRPSSPYVPTLMQVAKAYHYIIQVGTLFDNKAQKIVMGIYEICASRKDNTIDLYKICGYDVEKKMWYWNNHVGEDKREIALYENYPEFQSFCKELEKLSKKYPLVTDVHFNVYDGGQH